MASHLPSAQQQYATGLTRANIERTLAEAGKSPDTLEPADRAGLEDFHSRWLNDAVGLGERIEVIESDVCELPFASGSFDVVISQHVQMNIADKARVYAEARRVLAPGGRLALWDVTAADRA